MKSSRHIHLLTWMLLCTCVACGPISSGPSEVIKSAPIVDADELEVGVQAGSRKALLIGNQRVWLGLILLAVFDHGDDLEVTVPPGEVLWGGDGGSFFGSAEFFDVAEGASEVGGEVEGGDG